MHVPGSGYGEVRPSQSLPATQFTCFVPSNKATWSVPVIAAHRIHLNSSGVQVSSCGSITQTVDLTLLSFVRYRLAV